tara:strand:- start:376 stop:720 length:345 start_codon:yes stop_codon:yes gene_type:complete
MNFEHDVQCAICDYLDIRRICYWAVPNGGKRSKSEANRLKSEGVRPGVPDITIVHDGLYFGLEVKRPKTLSPKGRLSKNQKEMIEKIEDNGGEVKVVYGVEDVIEAFEAWGIGV